METQREFMLDITGQPVSCTDKKALECFNKGLTEYVLVRDNCFPHFEEALDLDESLIIAHSIIVGSFTVVWFCILLYLRESLSAAAQCDLKPSSMYVHACSATHPTPLDLPVDQTQCQLSCTDFGVRPGISGPLIHV